MSTTIRWNDTSTNPLIFDAPETEKEPFLPSRTPHKCPVCDGTGLVSKPPWVPGDQCTWDSTSCSPWTCKACGGTGIIWG